MESLASLVTYACTLVGIAAMVIGGLFLIFVLGIALLVLAGNLLESLWNKGRS